MLSTYLGEQNIRQHAAVLNRELEHRQRVHLALAHRQARRPEAQKRIERVMRRLHHSMQAWGTRLRIIQAEEHS